MAQQNEYKSTSFLAFFPKSPEHQQLQTINTLHLKKPTLPTLSITS
jgi:hypothetical protein